MPTQAMLGYLLLHSMPTQAMLGYCCCTGFTVLLSIMSFVVIFTTGVKGAPDPVARELYFQTEYCMNIIQIPHSRTL